MRDPVERSLVATPARFAGTHQHLARAELPHRDGRHQQFELVFAKAAQPIDLAQIGHQLPLERCVGPLVFVAARGAHVNAVGASTPGARELDVETVAASALYCDSRESLRNEAGEFRLALQQGAIAGEEHIRGELGEVLIGAAPGRQNDAELTLFRSLGIAVEDLAAAELAVANARRRGLGTELPL